MYFESLTDGPHRRTFLPSALLHVLALVLSMVLWRAAPALQLDAKSSVAFVIPARDTPPAATPAASTHAAVTQIVRRPDLPVRRFEFVPPPTVAPANLVTLPTPPMAPPSRPAPEMAMPVEMPAPPPPKALPAQPTTGLFAAAESHRDNTLAPSPQIASAGFSAAKTEHPGATPTAHTATGAFSAPQAARATSVAPASTASAGFAAPTPSQPAANTTRAASSSAGFSMPTVPQTPAAAPPAVKSGAFATSSAAGFTTLAVSQPPATQSPAVKSGSFAAASAQLPTARSRAETAPPIEVEILYKPKPVYTEEARRLKIEGEVLLEVIFTASGEVKVLRVSKGLGHGLDEAAIQAAAHIRFKPAERDGSKVDSTATARITFSLAF